MQATTTAVATQLLPAGAVLAALAELISELSGSRAMWQQLLDHLTAVKQRLAELQTTDAKTIKALAQYASLVDDVHTFLQTHVQRNRVARVATYWKVKSRVQQFYTDLDRIQTLLALDDVLDRVHRHSIVVHTLQRNRELDDQAAQDLAAAVDALRQDIQAVPDELAVRLHRDGVQLADLADLIKEIQNNRDAYSTDERNALKDVVKKSARALGIHTLPEIPSWYMSRADIIFDDGDPFATSASKPLRALYHGTTFSGSHVTVKAITGSPSDDKLVQVFTNEVKTWSTLRDPHILPLYGANHTAYPLLLVMGRAELGNYADYLATRRHRVWPLFLDAARGLAYLHKKKIVHGNLKCANLLVTARGDGVVADFGFSFVRANSALSAKPLAPSHHWKAPECFDPQHPMPRCESDVYALGMCMFEALTGCKPYAELDEDAAIDKITHGELPNVPGGANVDDEAWELITGMCDSQFTRRTKLHEVIAVLEVLAARDESRHERCACDEPVCAACDNHVS